MTAAENAPYSTRLHVQRIHTTRVRTENDIRENTNARASAVVARCV